MAKKKIQWKLFQKGRNEQHLKAQLADGGFRYKIKYANGDNAYFDSYADYRNRNAKTK